MSEPIKPQDENNEASEGQAEPQDQLPTSSAIKQFMGSDDDYVQHLKHNNAIKEALAMMKDLPPAPEPPKKVYGGEGIILGEDNNFYIVLRDGEDFEFVAISFDGVEKITKDGIAISQAHGRKVTVVEPETTHTLH